MFILLAMSCRQETLSDLREDVPVMTAIFETGSESAEVKLFHLGAHHQAAPVNIIDAEITLAPQSGGSVNLSYNNGTYVTGANAIDIIPGNFYRITAGIGDKEIKASCVIPPALSLANASNTTFTVNPNSLGTPSFILSWNSLDPAKYSYLLVLENLEENPVEIPFNVPSGNFTDQFSGPWEFDGATIYDTDFKYYGHHRLKIMAVEKSIESIYFYGPSDLRGLLQNGPDNVEGGRGYVIGVSSFTVDLWVQ